MAYDYDITVIGGGPGGYVAAIRAAKEKKKVCLIEKDSLGGVCLNEGCIPTKTLIKTANLYSEILHAKDFAIDGIEPAKVRVSMSRLQERRKAVIKQLVGGVGALVKANKIALVKGAARFVDKNTVDADGKKITSEYFVVATGSSTLMPSFIAQEGKNNVITSREALTLTEVPKSIAVIGGGVIGIEFAYLLNKLGSEVVVLELLENIMPMVDPEISGMAKKRLEKAGVTFNMGAKVSKIKDNAVYFEKDGKEQSVKADMVLMSVGRVPYSEGLGAKEIGVLYDRAAIITDSGLRTNIPNIYAIGDVNAKVMLAHTASHEGIVAVENICGQNHEMRYDRIPSCVYLDPEIGCIGITEEQAKKDGRKIKVGKFPMLANGKSLVEGDTDGMAKVIIDDEFGEILGVHIYAKHATDMIAEIAVAMTLEATADEIIESVHPHPTVSESIPEAFMAAYKRPIHSM